VTAGADVSPARSRAQAVVSAVAALAAALWLGGLVVLGAVVAPVIFRNVPAPTSADAMTLVFRRFDRVALACAAVLLSAEVLRVVLRARIDRADVARGMAAVGASALATWLALAVSPRIEALHRAGAIRGLGDLGRELDTVHALAENLARVELALLAVVVTLLVRTQRKSV